VIIGERNRRAPVAWQREGRDGSARGKLAHVPSFRRFRRVIWADYTSGEG
jgi:hypothetical protein